MTALALLALTMLPVEGVIDDRCDVIEINSLYDGEGGLVFQQIIFWDWGGRTGRRVVAWRLWKDPTKTPTRKHTGEWEVVWQDGKVLRRVTACCFRRTWTQFDPELADRKNFPRDKRRGLTNPTVHSAASGISNDDLPWADEPVRPPAP